MVKIEFGNYITSNAGHLMRLGIHWIDCKCHKWYLLIEIGPFWLAIGNLI